MLSAKTLSLTGKGHGRAARTGAQARAVVDGLKIVSAVVSKRGASRRPRLSDREKALNALQAAIDAMEGKLET
jgi:hypothetical protein